MNDLDAQSDNEAVTCTVVVPLHNHVDFVEERLESLFAQWQPGMELLLVDDGSTDGGFAVAERVVARNHRIQATTLRNATPLGVGMLPDLLRFSRGSIIIQADSDDVALPGRLALTLACFTDDPSCRLVTSNAVLLSADGFPIKLFNPHDPDQVFDDPRWAAETDGDYRWLGATIAFHRSVLENFPPLDPATCPYGLDLLMPFRAQLLGTHHYISRPLVGWRQHGRNTHHVVGATAVSPDAAERYQALELMVLAQKMRDAEHVALHPTGRMLPADLLQVCRGRFDARFDIWCRARAVADRLSPAPPLPSRGFPTQPPVITLRPGCRLGLGSQSPSAALASWPGFHRPEDWGAWTGRHVLVCLRLAPGVAALRADLVGLHFADRQRVSLSLGLEDWTEIDLQGGERRCVDLPVAATGLTWLTISAHDAAVPDNGDPRLLGVGLISLEAMPTALAYDTAVVETRTPSAMAVIDEAAAC